MKKIGKLNFGTAGIPLSTDPYNTLEGIAQVKKLGLSAMELEFVRSINISKENAPLVKNAAEKNNVVLTCHGQYFINLNAVEKKKLQASKARIINAANRAFQCGGWSTCFHPAYYMKQDAKKVYTKVKSALNDIVSTLKNDGIDIWIRPETAGKLTQFGSLNEILDLSSELENVLPCIDFSHIHARTNGKFNSFNEFNSVLELVEKKLGKNALSNMHLHVQGIKYSEFGEISHLPFNEADFKFKELLKALKEFKAKGVLICESPIMEKDTLKLLKTFKSI